MSHRLSHLTDREFDLLIVGGGIFGVGVAREAALHGWRVALVEQGDLGGETSSRSSKMIHGGLRYLERFELSLVRQALRERQVLWDLAPHLVHPCPFLVPIYRGSPRGLTKLRMGLFLYDMLAGRPRGFRRRMLSKAAVALAEPSLSTEGLRGGGVYYDWQGLDARLVAEVALQARESGAEIVTYAAATDLSGGPPGVFRARVEDRLVGNAGSFEVTARTVVATTGPWSDAFRMRSNGASDARVRLTTGIHITVDRVLERHAVVVNARSDGRVFFMLPFYGRTLIGTTDRDYEGDPGHLDIAPEDVDYLLEESNRLLGDVTLTRSNVIHAIVGVRTLARDNASHPSSTSREQSIWEEPRGCWHVIGGKLTTWRLIARELTERAAGTLGRRLDDGALSRSTRLPGGEGPSNAQQLAKMSGTSEATVSACARWFGSRTDRVLAPCVQDATLGDPIGPTVPETRAEILYATKVEGALRLVDVLRRRIPRLLLTRVAEGDLRAAAHVMAPELGWDAARIDVEVHAALSEQRLPF